MEETCASSSILKIRDIDDAVTSLSPETLALFRDCLDSSSSDPKTAMETGSLLSFVCRAYPESTVARLSRTIPRIINRLKDPDSGVRKTCRDLIVALSAIYLKGREGRNGNDSSSLVVAMFVEPLLDAISQVGVIGLRDISCEEEEVTTMDHLEEEISASSSSILKIRDIDDAVTSLSPPETLALFIECVDSSLSDPKPAMKTGSLLSFVCRAYPESTVARLSRTIPRIINRLKDPDSGVRKTCRDLIVALSGIYLKGREEGNGDDSSSLVVAMFVEPLLDAISQVGVVGLEPLRDLSCEEEETTTIELQSLSFSCEEEETTTIEHLSHSKPSSLSQQGRAQTKKSIKRRDKFMEQKHGISVHHRKLVHATIPVGNIKHITTQKRKILRWEIQERKPKEEDTMQRNWKVSGGFVRDQFGHVNCWSFTGADLCMAWLVNNNHLEAYFPLSTKYLTYHCNYLMRAREAAKPVDPDRGPHHCHKYDIAGAVEFIRNYGVPAEDPRDTSYGFNCISDTPERLSRNSPLLYRIPDNMEVKVSDELDVLFEMIRHGPVGANLLDFSPELFYIGEDIYEGPEDNYSEFDGLHAGLIVAITRYRGRLVALVKNSQGTASGDDGYIYVSLTTMVLGVGFVGSERDEYDLTTPSFLLRKFHSLEQTQP